MTVGTTLVFVLIFVLSYLIGSIPWGFLIGMLHGKDIRLLGSGNIGATNVSRVIGGFSGKICFVLDAAKGFLPVFVVALLIKNHTIVDPLGLAQIIAALGAILGHMFTIFLRFKGGKGISTAAGALLAMTPFAFLIAGITWVVIFLISRYVSLASITAAAVLPISATLLGLTSNYPTPGYVLVFLYALSVLAIFRHSGNIKRLCQGTEDRFERK